MEALLGLDVGTTNIKGVVYSVEGVPLAVASEPTPVVVQGVHQALHDPHALWKAMLAAIRSAMSALSPDVHIAGMAIASFGEAGVPLDAQGQELYPIIAWYDERTAPQAAWWAERVGEEEVYRHTGLPLGHTFTLNKLMWLREAEPALYARLSRWLCVADYMAYRLTGEQRMGYSLASRTMALNLRSRQWSSEMLAWAEMSAGLLPDVAPEGTLLGHVKPDAARETGLPQGLPVYVGGHDHVCGALAMGAFKPGIVLDSTGTTEAELVALERVEPHLETADLSFCLGCHVARERYYAIGSILGAGSMLRWLAELFWGAEASVHGEQALEALTHAAEGSPVGAHGLYVLPHFAGAGSPDRDSTARGVLVGLSLAHTRADIARATIEGLCYELRALWEALQAFTGQPIVSVVSVGGGARNALWSQIKADVTGRSLVVPDHSEAVTLGAAILASLGAGLYADEEEAVSRLRITAHQVQPRVENTGRYDRIYRRLVDDVRPLAVSLGRRSHSLASN